MGEASTSRAPCSGCPYYEDPLVRVCNMGSRLASRRVRDNTGVMIYRNMGGSVNPK